MRGQGGECLSEKQQRRPQCLCRSCRYPQLRWQILLTTNNNAHNKAEFYVRRKKNYFAIVCRKICRGKSNLKLTKLKPLHHSENIFSKVEYSSGSIMVHFSRAESKVKQRFMEQTAEKSLKTSRACCLPKDNTAEQSGYFKREYSLKIAHFKLIHKTINLDPI